MRAAGAVDELEIDVDGLAVTAEPNRDLLVAHLVEVERRVALLPGRPGDRGTGHRRHVDLGLDPGDGDLRDLGDLRWQRTLLDQENVRGEACAFVHRLDVRDDPGNAHRQLPWQLTARHDHVVELKVLVRGDRNRELQRSRRSRADDEAYWLRPLKTVHYAQAPSSDVASVKQRRPARPPGGAV